MTKNFEKEVLSFPFGQARNLFSGEKLYNDDGGPMAFPFECGEGWNDLLLDLFRDLDVAFREDNVNPDHILLSQIKEKFGGLRVYLSPETVKVEEVIRKYEELSYTVCEVCGKPGKLRDDQSWWRTLCDEHA